MHVLPSTTTAIIKVGRGTLMACAIMVLAMAGCQSQQSKTTGGGRTAGSDAPFITLDNTDACAARLHDISGAFLMYWDRNKDLPHSLDELKPFARMLGVQSLTCPANDLPYIYTRDGILLPEQNARIVLYDPQPSPPGYRWAISIGASSSDEPPQTKVVAFPESFFQWRQ